MSDLSDLWCSIIEFGLVPVECRSNNVSFVRCRSLAGKDLRTDLRSLSLMESPLSLFFSPFLLIYIEMGFSFHFFGWAVKGLDYFMISLFKRFRNWKILRQELLWLPARSENYVLDENQIRRHFSVPNGYILRGICSTHPNRLIHFWTAWIETFYALAPKLSLPSQTRYSNTLIILLALCRKLQSVLLVVFLAPCQPLINKLLLFS